MGTWLRAVPKATWPGGSAHTQAPVCQRPSCGSSHGLVHPGHGDPGPHCPLPPSCALGTRTQDLTVPCIPGCAPGPATVPFLMCLGCVQGLSFAEGPCLSGQGSRIGSQIPGLMSDLHAQLPGLWRSVGPALWSMLAHFPVHIGRCAGGISVVGRLEEAARGVPAR